MCVVDVDATTVPSTEGDLYDNPLNVAKRKKRGLMTFDVCGSSTSVNTNAKEERPPFQDKRDDDDDKEGGKSVPNSGLEGGRGFLVIDLLVLGGDLKR